MSRAWPVVLLLLAVRVLPADAQGTVVVPLPEMRITREVKSFKELREAGVVRQQLDYSCGAAAMATLMTYFFEQAVTEDQVIGFIFVHGQTPEEGLKKYFRRKGFSLLDLKRYAEFRGFKAAGFKEMNLDDLAEALRDQQVPVLVPINPFGYHHFVVVRGLAGDRIFLADPAVGQITMKISRFLDLWIDGIGFMVTRRQAAALRLSARAPATDHELAQVTAAGVPGGRVQTAQAQGPAAPAVAPAPTPPPADRSLVNLDGPVPDSRQLQPTIFRQPTAGIPNMLPVFTNERGTNLFGIFRMDHYNPRIQFGDPEGKFIDFSPPPGQDIQIRP